MELSEYLRDPTWAALIAGAATAAYIHIKMKMNKESKLPVSGYAKPAALVAILVFFIVQNGVGKRESISSEPF